MPAGLLATVLACATADSHAWLSSSSPCNVSAALRARGSSCSSGRLIAFCRKWCTPSGLVVQEADVLVLAYVSTAPHESRSHILFPLCRASSDSKRTRLRGGCCNMRTCCLAHQSGACIPPPPCVIAKYISKDKVWPRIYHVNIPRSKHASSAHMRSERETYKSGVQT